MQEEQKESQEKKSDLPEEAGNTNGVDDPSLEEEDPSLEEEELVTSHAEDQSSEDNEGESVEEEIDLLAEEAPQRRGCLTGCIIPLAVLFLVVVVVFTIGYSKRDVIGRWLLKGTVDNIKNNVLDDLPADMDENQIEAAFEEIGLALKEGRVNEQALAAATEEFLDAIEGMPSVEQRERAINKLIKDLRAAIMRGNR